MTAALNARRAAEICSSTSFSDRWRSSKFSLARDHNPDLELEGIVVNQFQSRANLPARMVEELRTEGLPVVDPFLTPSVKVKESHEASTPLVELAPGHKLARLFEELWDTLEQRIPEPMPAGTGVSPASG